MRRIILLTSVSLSLLAAACSPTTDTASAPAPVFDPATTEQLKSNPLLAEWGGPNGGVPAFDKMDITNLEPAMTAAMAAHFAEIDAIAANKAKPTFDNTLGAMEKAGKALDRVQAYYGIWSSNMSSPDFRKVQAQLAPKIAEHGTQIIQNAALFSRIKALKDQEASLKLTPQQKRLLDITYDRFQLSGAALDDKAKARYAAINKELADVQTKFANNLLADEEGWVTYLKKNELGGLPADFVAAAAAEAKARKHDGEWAVTNTRSSMDPFLTYSTERGLRETVWRNYYNRGDNGDEHDNNANIAKILQLRDERVKLLGYANYAEWQLKHNMAKTPEAANKLMDAVWVPAVARVKEEVADMQAVADSEAKKGEGAKITIAPWDYRFYAEKVRKAKYDFDATQLKPYFQLDKLREGMFYVAGELFGFQFTPVPDGQIPVWQADVKVWEVTDKASGKHIGYWYLDPYARPGKRSGGWTSGFRSHSTFDGPVTALATNNSNFVKPAPGEPLLISFDDATTFFHEFGHALHALSSNVDYPGLNGGLRDYTEFQSQLLEHWLLSDKVVKGYLVNKDGKPVPDELIAKLNKAATFNQGFLTVEFLADAIMDMKYHMVDPTGIDPKKFEPEELAKLGMPKEIPMRHRSTQFAHIFSSEGYAAGYYGYLWADVLTSDAAEAFREAPGGYYDKDLAKKLVDDLFAPRNSVDPSEAYRTFRGRDATIDALMKDRGFPVPAATGTGSK